VIVSGGQQGGVYHLSVADKGRGLPAEALERIREIQTGVKKRPERLGEDEVPGLGYVIITELVLVLGGRLMVESSSKGARITIMLPMEDRTRGKEAAQVPAAAL
jgi:signal transduction histidine kinase